MKKQISSLDLDNKRFSSFGQKQNYESRLKLNRNNLDELMEMKKKMDQNKNMLVELNEEKIT